MHTDDDTDADPLAVPWREISPAALRGLVESFVLREGTDYGEQEFALEEKVQHVMRQLARGEAEVVYDPRTDSVNIVVTAARRPRA